jgi:signal transduction histidine kinase
MGGALLLPVTTAALAAAIFAADTITDLEIAVPVFYTAIILLSVSFLKKSGIVFVGIGCIALTLLSDLLTVNTGVSEAGVINTALSLLAITSTTFLAVKIQSSKLAASEAQSQLAHVVRVTTLGELAASIAHEVNQPLAAAVINGNACLEWLAAHPPNFDEARRAAALLVEDTHRASHILAQVRALTKGSTFEKGPLDINKTILATVALIAGEIQRSEVSVQTQLSNDLPIVDGDRVQLQQVILNQFRTRGQGLRGRISTVSSMPSIRPSPTAWAWVSPFAARSSRTTAAAYGRHQIRHVVPSFNSRCRPAGS